MTVTESIKQKLDQAAAIIRMQTARIEELTAENERLRSTTGGAHATLRLIYSDPSAPRSDRIKAASASLPHETPKLMPERQVLDLKPVEPRETLGQICERRLARADAMDLLSLEQREALIRGVKGSEPLNGNGSERSEDGTDDSGNGDDSKE
jgi:hypothetical protein